MVSKKVPTSSRDSQYLLLCTFHVFSCYGKTTDAVEDFAGNSTDHRKIVEAEGGLEAEAPVQFWSIPLPYL